MTTAPAPPQNVRPDDHNKIRRLGEDYLAAEEAKDLPGLLGLLTDDVIFLMPAAAPLRGKAAVESLYRTFFAQFTSRHAATVEEIVVAGDWAFAWGEESLKLTAASGQSAEMRGKGMSILRRQADGSWKFARGINNLQPVPTAASR